MRKEKQIVTKISKRKFERKIGILIEQNIKKLHIS